MLIYSRSLPGMGTGTRDTIPNTTIVRDLYCIVQGFIVSGNLTNSSI